METETGAEPRPASRSASLPRPAVARDPQASRNPLTAGGWSGLSFIAANIIGGFVYYPLARRLTPEDFGLYAEANLLYLGAVLLAETAVVRALVQMQAERAALAQAAVWLATALGIVGAAVCVAAAPLMAAIFREGELLPLLLVMAPGVVVAGLGAAPHALLFRELDFRRKALPETLSLALGGIAALVAAFAGLGVYSLAAMALVQTATSTTVAWRVCRLRPRWSLPDGAVLRRMASFTLTLGAGDVARYLRLNTDYALTGRLLGTTALGVYSMAWATSAGPNLFISAFTGPAGYAVYARLQHDRERLRRVFLSALRVIGSAALPVCLGAVVVAPDLVPVALGDGWDATIGPLMILFVLQLIRTVSAPAAGLILALGHSRLYALVGAAGLPATVIAVLVGTRGGVEGVAWAMLAAVGGVSLVFLALGLRLLRIRPADLAQAFTIPAALTVAVVPCVALARWLLLWQWETPTVLRLAVAIGAGLLAALLLIWRLWPTLRADFLRLRHALPEDSAP